MKGKNAVMFVAVILMTAVLTWIAVGVDLPGFKMKNVRADTRYGIDIKGGVSVIFSAPDGVSPTNEEMKSVVKVLENRLDSKGILDRNIVQEVGKGRVIVDFPWKAGETNFNAEEQAAELGSTAMLKFTEISIDPMTNERKPVGNPIITGKNVKKASVQQDTSQGGMLVALELDAEGAIAFEKGTERLVNKPIAIYLDDRFISDPIVNQKISGGNAVITFGSKNRNDSIKEATDLANVINAGSLPFALVTKGINSISPNLGMNALKVSKLAGVFAIALVWLFMFLYYRLPGLLANIALLLHTVIQLLFIMWSGITLTLPGIAGVILTIGMGVDANVIIFERIKEELRNGKTLRVAIDVGFKRAFSAILDANITTLISGVVLYVFGTGPVKSFAITLMLGVFLSFFTAITASRILLKSVSNLNLARHPWLYGVSSTNLKQNKIQGGLAK